MLKTQTVSDTTAYPRPLGESQRSAVSWAAIFAGAVIGAALTITLITGGAGLGFLAISPWQYDGASGTSIAIGTVVWLLVTQIIAYGIAGYVTGRLRTKWSDVKRDEIHFRDTAHGFVVWALSSVVGFVLLSSVAANMAAETTKAGASVVGAGAVAAAGTAAAASDEDTFSLDYYTDSLLRPQEPGRTFNQGDSRKEVGTILTRSVMQGEITPEDENYLVQVIAQRADMSEMEARARLEEVTARAKQAAEELKAKAREAADEARKAAAIFSLWAFASLLLGAFVASFAATIGGRARDL